MSLQLFISARQLLERFGLGAYGFALEAALQAQKQGEPAEAAEWFDIADAVEHLIVAGSE